MELEKILGDHNGMVYATSIYMEKQETGEWLIKQSVTQRRSDDLKIWDERNVEFEAKDRVLEKAIGEAAVLTTLYLESINYDLFTEEQDLEEGEYIQ